MSYWSDRRLKVREALLDGTIKGTELKLMQQYRRTSATLIRKIEALYYKLRAEAEGGDVLASHLYQYNRYYDLLSEINRELELLGDKEINTLKGQFLGLYEKNSKIVGEQIGVYSIVDPERAEQVINAYWVNDGKNWSSRVWTNKQELGIKLQNGLLDTITTGASPDQLKKTLMKAFDVSYNDATRVVRTELCHIYNQSTLDMYEEAGITQYQFLATEDERECEDCQELDGQIFDIRDNKLPVHPNCRCTVLAVINEGRA